MVSRLSTVVYNPRQSLTSNTRLPTGDRSTKKDCSVEMLVLRVGVGVRMVAFHLD